MKRPIPPLLPLSLLLFTLFNTAVEGWRYEQKISAPNDKEDYEYGAIVSDIVAYSNGTVLFAVSTKYNKTYVLRNGHSYHKWIQYEYDIDHGSDVQMHTSGIALTDSVLFVGLESADRTNRTIRYFWIRRHGKDLAHIGPGQVLEVPNEISFIQNETLGRLFAVTRDSVHAAAYIIGEYYGYKVGVLYYWTRSGATYKTSGRFITHESISGKELVFLKYINSYIAVGSYDIERRVNKISLVNKGDKTDFYVDCPNGTVLGDASVYDADSLLAVSCICPYNSAAHKGFVDGDSEGEEECVAAVLVYQVTFENITLLKRLDNPGANYPELNFGKSICIFTDTLVIGAPYYDEYLTVTNPNSNGDREGSDEPSVGVDSGCDDAERPSSYPFVYLYRNYKLENRVYMDAFAARKGFGTAVSVMGDFLAVSSPSPLRGEDGSIGSPHVFLFSVSQFSAEVVGIILFGFLIISILVILSVLTYYKMHPMSVSAVQPELK